MKSSIEKAFSCFKIGNKQARKDSDDDDESLGVEGDELVWFQDLEKHSHGEFSFAVVQANAPLEDHSQVETGRHATFVGVYDGHGGPDTSRYIADHLFGHLLRIAQENNCITEDTLKSAFTETENGFLNLVRRAFGIKPELAAVGSCCLVGVIWRRTLYVANAGDSRAVIGRLDRSNKIVAEQLTRDHNVNAEAIRNEVRDLHPDDPQIVVKKQGVWRVKGIIQVSRAIGDACLKQQEFALPSIFPKFHLPEPLLRPVLTADPETVTRVLQPNDRFIIFASDGLWEFMTNKEAVDIVNNNPVRQGIAKRLLVRAMEKAARARNMVYGAIKKVGPGERRTIHDDITVVVIFIDDNTVVHDGVSVRGFVGITGASRFDFPA